MSNMSYCRFRNTEKDLLDCYEHIHDKLRERANDYDSEKAARQRLIELCQLIVNEECEVDDDKGTITVHEYDDEDCDD